MSILRPVKGLLLGLILVVAYSCFILDIIMILKVQHYSHTRPPAVIALLVSSLLQSMYTLYLLMSGGKGKKNSASTVMAATGFFASFTFGSIVALTVLRHHTQYCNLTLVDNSDVCGVLRGTEGLGWALFGFNLIYLVFLPFLVMGGGSWSTPLADLPHEEVYQEEKAAH
ncbi:hypothetical protein IAR55_002310 [Kwoniella newhampshirensis]|uniref:MARVEL domain-containing protein n=1 Tax=Kwoniella newhampshirensis TaxID=1651941 RepID=A0AAW0YSD8_9TREE